MCKTQSCPLITARSYVIYTEDKYQEVKAENKTLSKNLFPCASVIHNHKNNISIYFRFSKSNNKNALDSFPYIFSLELKLVTKKLWTEEINHVMQILRRYKELVANANYSVLNNPGIQFQVSRQNSITAGYTPSEQFIGNSRITISTHSQLLT